MTIAARIIENEVSHLLGRTHRSSYELIDLFKQTMPDTKNTGSTTLDFLIKQILLASESTKSRMNEIVIEEVLNVAGCSQEQTFDPQQKIYVSVEEIDLREILKNDPTSEPWSLRYEKNDISVGTTPFSMDRELNHRLQNEGISFSSEYGSDYFGASGQGIFDIKYVTSYTEGGTTYFGNFYEISLKNRLKGDKMKFIIVSIEPKQHRLGLSIKAMGDSSSAKEESTETPPIADDKEKQNDAPEPEVPESAKQTKDTLATEEKKDQSEQSEESKEKTTEDK